MVVMCFPRLLSKTSHYHIGQSFEVYIIREGNNERKTPSEKTTAKTLISRRCFIIITIYECIPVVFSDSTLLSIL